MAEIKTEAVISHEGEKQEKSSMLMETFRRTLRSFSAKVGFFLFVFIILISIFANVIAPYKLNDMDLASAYTGPSAKHIMGCDALGRDLFTRLLYGGRTSLKLGFGAQIIGTVAGILIGAVAGYFGGHVENIIMRLMDVWAAIPSQLLTIIIATAFGPGFWQTLVAMSIGGVPGGVRQTRAQFLKERGREYVEAAEVINCSKFSIMMRHIFPNACAPMIVSTTMGIGMTITSAAGLAYIGLGVQPPTPEWGTILNDGKEWITKYPHLLIYPGLFIAVTVLAVNLLGDGLRDALDPKLRD
jgi:ABC-type dipeptide/oligopeptide/nickel transport system permease subunit